MPHNELGLSGSSLRKDLSNHSTVEIPLAHSSAKEYLSSNRLEERFQKQLLAASDAKCIATVALTYFLQLGLDTDPSKVKSRFPLASYSATYWTRFTRHIEAEDEAVVELSLRLLSHRENYARWLSLYDPDRPWSGGIG